jgi:hypothetical protein
MKWIRKVLQEILMWYRFRRELKKLRDDEPYIYK